MTESKGNMRKVILLIGIMLLTALAVQADDAKLGGRIFMHYSYEDAAHNAFEIKRTYLTYEHRLNNAISYKLQMDAGSGGASSYSVFIKNAKLDWQTNLGKITLGIQETNIFSIQQSTWPFRFIEKTPMDLKHYSSSADLGISWSDKFGIVGTNVMLSNGGGYKQAETDGHKRLALRLHMGQSKLKEGFNAGVVISHEAVDYGVDSTGASLVLSGFGGLVWGSLTIGAEYDMHTVKTYTEETSTLISAYGRLKLSEKLIPFMRIDYFNEDASLRVDSETYLIAGVNFKPEAGLSAAPNLRVRSTGNAASEIIYYVNFQFKF